MNDRGDAAASEISSVIAEMGAAYQSKDLERLLGFFAEDFVALPPGRPPVTDLDTWKTTLSVNFARQDVSDLITRSEDIIVTGDWAIEWHTEAAIYTPRDGGGPQRRYNKGMWVFRRDSPSSWKVVRWVWNATPDIEALAGTGSG